MHSPCPFPTSSKPIKALFASFTCFSTQVTAVPVFHSIRVLKFTFLILFGHSLTMTDVLRMENSLWSEAEYIASVLRPKVSSFYVDQFFLSIPGLNPLGSSYLPPPYNLEIPHSLFKSYILSFKLSRESIHKHHPDPTSILRPSVSRPRPPKGACSPIYYHKGFTPNAGTRAGKEASA